MATDSVNITTEDAEMAECDGDKVVTMMDVLQEQQDFEEDANAVLGASDDKNCTYSKGYIKRQALYACLTCCLEAKTDPTKRAGVCLACSLNCHENHELIELYTKRNFRCDCGNPKFNSHPCTFTPDKVDLNSENIYNQNFSGLYCTCQRPYPDPESTIEEDMIQCIICEDWLHASHLEAVVPVSDQYAEMICKACMEKNEFLHDYSLIAVNAESEDFDVINGDAKSPENTFCNGESAEEKLVNGLSENKTDNDADVTDNRVVEINDINENGVGNGEDGLENVKIDKEISESPEASKETIQNESIESKPEENHNPNNQNNNEICLDTGNKKPEEEELNKLATNNETSVTPKDLKIDDKNTSAAEPDDDENAIGISSKTDPNNEASTDDQTVTEEKTDTKYNKIENTKMKPEETDEAKKHTEAQEQNVEISENNGSEDVNDEDKTEQEQHLDDLSTLTDDNSTSKLNKDMATNEKPAEGTEQSEDSKIKDIEINNEEVSKETNESNDQHKPVSEEKSLSPNVKVSDTSQSENEEKENTDIKTDSVMDAIDELLQTANESEESKNAKDDKESASESTSSKDTVENVETTDSNDVEMKNENELDNDVPKKADDITDAIHTTSTNDGTKDVEMTDASVEKEPIVNESQADDNSTIGSGSKDEKDIEIRNSVSESEASALDNESPKDEDEKSEVTDTVNDNSCNEKENEALNTVEKKIGKNTDENDSANKIDLCSNDNTVHNAIENTKEHKRKLSTDLPEDISSKKAKLECVRPKGVKRVHKGATFWPSNFRQKLCTCAECLTMYKDLKVLFLTDLEDTVFAYESLGKDNVAGGSQYEKGLQALSSLDRVQQINALTEYNNMRDKLLDFLKSFKDRKEIVKEEDIKAFFAGMKPRREPDGVYFCR